MNEPHFRLGLVVNPWAGIGGPAGLRGSDGVREQALARGSVPRAGDRAVEFLRALADVRASTTLLTWGGDMGEAVARLAGWVPTVAGVAAQHPSEPADTRAAAARLAAAGVDLLVFVGGDGTARDVCAAVGRDVPALGVPAGVKMYSGVFAVAPVAAADIVRRLVQGRPTAVVDAEVRDIDEDAFRHDRVASRHFGELRVPGVGDLVQHIKCGPPGDESVDRAEIAAFLAEVLPRQALWLVGTGSTPKALLDALGLPASLLGIDAVLDGRLVAADLDAAAAQALLAQHAERRLVVTATGGQGFLLGRGNQQLSPAVLRGVGRGGLVIVATPAKLAALAGRPLLVDTGDPALDRELAGLHEVVTGYERRVLYRVAAAGDQRDAGP